MAATATITHAPAAEEAQDECPMHAAKHSRPEHPKKSGCPDLPCCKKLPASNPANSQWIFKPIVWLEAPDYLPTVLDLLNESHRSIIRLRLDTGPPGPDIFLQLVLQRSTPAHAPPVRVI